MAGGYQGKQSITVLSDGQLPMLEILSLVPPSTMCLMTGRVPVVPAVLPRWQVLRLKGR